MFFFKCQILDMLKNKVIDFKSSSKLEALKVLNATHDSVFLQIAIARLDVTKQGRTQFVSFKKIAFGYESFFL